MRSLRRLLAGAAAAAGTLFLAVVPAGRADAHPLGSLTVNAALDVVVRPDRLDVTYVLDLAELPTVQARQQIDAAGDETAWATARCDALAAGVRIGSGTAAVAGAPMLAFPPGQGGLETLRLSCPLRGPAGATTVTDTNDVDRIGWREVVVRGDGMRITASDAPAVSPSALLVSYPEGGSPRRQLSASFAARSDRTVVASGSVAAPPVRPATRGADGLTRRLQDAVGDRQLTLPLGLLGVVLAFALGGMHSLAPGHGKTVMAATVVARRGAATRQVLTIGATVAATHTAGVLALGLVIWSSQAVAPDRVLPWLTLASGGLLVVTGATLLVRRLRGGPGHHHHGHVHLAHHTHDDHPHPHPHDHTHHDDHPHPHPHDRHDREPAGPLSRRWLVAMGMAGGMVPTPSALVVLLGAAALGRTWFGVVLVAVYGVGMAATLLAAGVALVRLQGWLERHWYGTRWLNTVLRVAPVVTAVALMAGGTTLALRSMTGV